MKKLLWILGGLFVALLVAVVSVPLFVHVDQYRPQIEAEVNKRINGKLELGPLKLSLWGAIKIHADSIRLSVNGFEKPVVDTKQFHLEIPFSSIFSGAPQVVAVLSEARIYVVKEANGKTNALELLKVPGAVSSSADESLSSGAIASDDAIVDSVASQSAASEKSAPPAQDPSSTASAPVALAAPAASAPSQVPSLLADATLGLRIVNGDLLYEDRPGKSSYQVKGLDLEARNLGLGSTMHLRVEAPLEGKMPGIVFSGPVRAVADITPVVVGSAVKSARGMVDVDATQLAITMPDTFVKPAGMALTLKLSLDGDERETLLRQAELRFHEYKFFAKGRLTTEPVTAKVEITADPMRLERLGDFVPMVKPYALKGNLTLQASVDLTPQALRLNGDLKATEGSFFLKDVLKAPLQFQAQAGFSENSLNLARTSLSGPDTELQLVGGIRNFLAPQFTLALTGKSFNVDQVLVLPAAGAPAQQARLAILPVAYAAEPKPGMEVNPLAKLAANPIVAKAGGVFNANVGRITAYGTNFEQAQVKSQLRPGMLLNLQEASFRTFGGLVKSTGEFDLKSASLPFRTQGNVSGISGKEAFATYFPKYKNTLEGLVNASWNVSGAAFPPAARIRSLKGSAQLVARDGVLKSVDFQESINSIMAKVPFLKDKKRLELDDGFKTLTADITFAGGVIQANPIEVQPRNRGFVVKGRSVIQESLQQESFFDVYDPQGRLPKEIQVSGKPALAVRFYGPITAPQTDYEYTVKRLATNAGTNAAKDLAGKALDKFLGGKGQGQGGAKSDALKDAADKLRKKLKLF